MRRLLVIPALLLIASCHRPGPAPASEASEPSTAKSMGKTTVFDLGGKGLPLVLDAPSCVQLSAPAIKIADNARDVILSCETDGLQTFAIQVGPSKGKIWKKEMEAEAEFKRWVKADGDFLQREVQIFGATKQDFAYRSKVKGVEYMCFSVDSTDDAALLSTMIAACRSLRAR